MTETKWTEGTWEVNDNGDVRVAGSGAFVGYPPQPGMICSLSDGEYIDNENWHDAHLIAAAPDLYNALSVLADAWERKGLPCDAARAALAKARGKS